MSDDATLKASVMEELEWEPSLDAAHIGVTAKHGVVTLSGFVDSYAAKITAERAESRVHGVKAIAEEIDIRLPNAQKRADDKIAERAVRILAWDIQVPHERIQVKVEHGVITLSGDVDYQRTAAESDMRQLGGVRGVANMLRVVPPIDQPADPAGIKHRTQNALRRNAEIEASHISVTVDAGQVTLRGRVKAWAERSVAASAAWAAPGVTEVRDELNVEP